MIVNRNTLVYKHRPWFSDTLYSKKLFQTNSTNQGKVQHLFSLLNVLKRVIHLNQMVEDWSGACTLQ